MSGSLWIRRRLLLTTVVAILVAGCASPVPTPPVPSATNVAVASPTPAPSVQPSSSTGPAPAPSPTPAVACQDLPEAPATTLTCANAVVVANTLVQPQSAITSITFHYGDYCPIGYFCALAVPSHGYVVFDMADPLPDLRVAVAANAQGVVTASTPVPMPASTPS